MIPSTFLKTFDELLNDVQYQPKSFIKTNEENYMVNLLLPGLTKKDLEIIVKDVHLTISYENKENNGYVDSFERTYKIPNDVDHKKIDAKMENGVLTITLHKEKEKIKKRLIQIS